MFKNIYSKLNKDRGNKNYGILRTRINYQKIANARMQIIFLIALCVFGLIVFRLYYIQIVSTEVYEKKLEAYASVKQYTTTPRGQMLDANGKVVVGNKESLNIVYNEPLKLSEDEEWELFEKFADTFSLSTQHLTDRDLRELYLILDVEGGQRFANGNRYLNDVEYNKAMRGELKNSEVYNLKLERIDAKDIAKISESKKKSYAIKMLLNNSTKGQAVTVIEGINANQAAYLSENEEEFPGFSIAFDWKREYYYGDSMKSILGSVSTSKQGLPSDSLLYYTALGYPLNERVGTSGLEEHYEYLLSGKRTVSEVKYNSAGIPNFNQLNSGRNGYDLQLTVDMELQKEIDQILLKYLENTKNDEFRRYMDSLYVTLMDPRTGNIYAMSGKTRNEEGIIYDNASGNYQVAIMPGSTVKGATVYMGLNEGVVKSGEKILDAPILLYGTQPKSSYNATIGLADEIIALQKSSNVYMWHIAMRMGGTKYYDNCPLVIKDDTLDIMKSYYSSFGLGTQTGIDVENEASGYSGINHNAGLVLDYVIGQYESYTMIQLAQYASTIANDGIRIKPRLVSSAYETNTNRQIAYENPIEYLNTIKGDTKYLDNVQRGFRSCAESGWCGSGISSFRLKMATKTGTAETYFYDNKDKTTHNTSNALLIGYGPYENANLAFSCSAPFSSVDKAQPNLCTQIMPEVLDAFYKKYPSE